MATVTEIERLRVLVDRLLPLSSRSRGEVIAAEDWNTVVGALLEVARSVVDSGADRAVAPHDHPDQVKIGWLEPRLRALIERGPLDDPVAVARINAVERGVSSTDVRLDALTADLRELRQSASRLEVSGLGREATITRLTRRVDGLGDARDDVSTLRGTLDALRDEMATVTSFADGLRGVTPAALRQGLEAMNDLRTRLTTTSGSLLDATEFERRLAELSTTSVSDEELTTAIGAVRVTIPDDLSASLLEQARAAAQRQSEQSTAVLAEQVRGQIASRLAEVEAVATRAVTEMAGQLRDAVRIELHDSLRQELSGAIAGGDDALRAELSQAVAAATAALEGAIDQRVVELQTSVGDLVSTAIERIKPELTASISATLATAITREELTAALAAETDRVRTELMSAVDTRVDRTVRTRLDERLRGPTGPVDPTRPAGPNG